MYFEVSSQVPADMDTMRSQSQLYERHYCVFLLVINTHRNQWKQNTSFDPAMSFMILHQSGFYVL